LILTDELELISELDDQFAQSSLPFSGALTITGVLFWDRRRPRLPTLQLWFPEWRAVQARTPAVPEERALTA